MFGGSDYGKDQHSLTRSDEKQAEIEALAARAGAGTATTEAAPIHHDRSVVYWIASVHETGEIRHVNSRNYRTQSTIVSLSSCVTKSGRHRRPACIAYNSSRVFSREDGVGLACFSCVFVVATSHASRMKRRVSVGGAGCGARG